MAINNTLKDIREERNLVQADLAKAVGSCSDTIGRIERGERNALSRNCNPSGTLSENASRRDFSN